MMNGDSSIVLTNSFWVHIIGLQNRIPIGSLDTDSLEFAMRKNGLTDEIGSIVFCHQQQFGGIRDAVVLVYRLHQSLRDLF